MARVNDILDTIFDPELFAPWFEQNRLSWSDWMVFLKTIFGLPMTLGDRGRYFKYTKRTERAKKQFDEVWLVVGRRGGKSIVLALVAVFLACFRDYRPYLMPGERATIIIIAADRKQARVIFRYIMGFLQGVPVLNALIKNARVEAVDLARSVSIEIHTASFRSVRGYTFAAILLDEIAFWRDELSANPDQEILDALIPGMATIPNAILLGASSPYARRGVLWQNYKDYFGKNDDDVLVWQAATWEMHPNISRKFIDRKYEKDPVSATAEYGANFRTDVSGLVPPNVYEDCVMQDREEIAYSAGCIYRAFTDPSGGSKDSFSLSIAHREERGIILDLVYEVLPPFKPKLAVKELCAILKKYKLISVTGDRYGGNWPSDEFQEHGITYEVSELTKSELYLEYLPLLMSREVELLDIKKLEAQTLGLERRTSRIGRDSVDHGPGAHDDLVNSAAGAVVNASEGWKGQIDMSDAFVGPALAASEEDFSIIYNS